MNIISDFRDDVRHWPHQSGGYEWWYFDALSSDEKYSFVIIFYEGNPFSTRYNGALLDGEKAMPAEYPAISISVYEDGMPIYYSFTEFDKFDCEFDEEHPFVQVGPHKMEIIDGKNLNYQLTLDEILANGDQIEASLTFKGPKSKSIFSNRDGEKGGHLWNLVQPRAKVEGEIQISAENENPKEIDFKGRGYHDHNTGHEPMRDEFTDWYWGRVHFDYATLVYYVMNRQDEEQHQAWLIGNDNQEVLETFDRIEMVDKGLTLFGLHTARKIGLRSNQAEVQVQLSQLLDNGPFYQRYQSDAFLRIADEQMVESQTGISEYIRPDRIFSRIFWPFVDMRIWYKKEKPHWVQKSKRLYRWTW